MKEEIRLRKVATLNRLRETSPSPDWQNKSEPRKST